MIANMDIKKLCQYIQNEERKQEEQHQMEQAITLFKQARHEPQPIQHIGFKRLICQLFVQNTIVLAIHRLWNIQDNTPLYCTVLYSCIYEALNSPDARNYVQIQRNQGIPIETSACQYINAHKPISPYCPLLANNEGCDQAVGQFFDAMQKVFINNFGNFSINRYKNNTVILQQGDIIADNDYKIIWVLHEVLRQMPLGFFCQRRSI